VTWLKWLLVFKSSFHVNANLRSDLLRDTDDSFFSLGYAAQR
jgi:hypothetical protein